MAHSQRTRLTNKIPGLSTNQDDLLFEACERRLVLSAQLLFDVLGDQALDFQNEPQGPAIPIEATLASAHAISGMDAVSANFGLTGSGQTVAVIDSGIAWDHVALGGGYGPGYRVVGGWDFAENDDQPYDDGPVGFHGTHVGGIIGSDDPIHQGVASDVDLVSLRVFDDVGQGQLDWIESALQWVHDNRNSFENPITTVNISIGTVWNSESIPEWANLEEELQQLYEDGIVVTAAAGNSFQEYNEVGLSYPAASSYVLPVASIDDNGQLSDFSQRSGSILAAPGSNISSTVPDHVLGRDGDVNDFSGASGTSMAAPYVAGASVLVRQAMELSGWESINASMITEHLRSTADSVFDSLTGLTYDVLNVENAIESILPDDNVGDSLATAQALDLSVTQIETWLNTTTDTDVYSFTASANGTLDLDLASEWIDSASWTLHTAGQEVGAGQMDPASVELIQGQSYELRVSADAAIGPLAVALSFEEIVSQSGGNEQDNLGGDATALGNIDYLEQNVAAGANYSVTATQDGTFTIQWTNPDSQTGSISVLHGSEQTTTSEHNWTNGTLRVDVQVQAGETLEFSLPGSQADEGTLSLANVLQHSGTDLSITGTMLGDTFELNLQNGTSIEIGSIQYAFSEGEVTHLTLDGQGSNDVLTVTGSSGSDKVDLRPGASTIVNSQLSVDINSVEEISYASGGGPDRVYLYDSDTDDTLVARPGEAELTGVGYRFDVQQVDRIFIHATGGGQDFAYLHDSLGDDHLSVRPQFTSMSGDGFFNYVRGFERVYAYADAGGVDSADLYDSEHDDRFSTSGVSASIVGPGFSSFTRSFEEVNAFSNAGGNDLATLYGSDSQTNWQQGTDFVSFAESSWEREARGFSDIETYVDNFLTNINALSAEIDSPSAAPLLSGALELGNNPAQVSDVPLDTPIGTPIDSRAAAEQQHASLDALREHDFGHYSQISSEFTSVELGAAELSTESALFEQIETELADIIAANREHAAETESMWQYFSAREAIESRFQLPEEQLLDDPELEQAVLDEAFSLYSKMFD